MSDLPYSDPSNPALPSPLFSDLAAVRGDHMRANNAAIFADLIALNTRNPEPVALTGGSFKTAALANANTYNGRSFFTCTAGVSDTPSAAAWLIIGYWNPTDSSGRFVAMADTSLETWEINYAGAAWGTWKQRVDSDGNAMLANSIKDTGTGAGTVRKKIIEIGDWNMDSTGSINVAHGLTYTKIRTINVIIRRDSPEAVFDNLLNDGKVSLGLSDSDQTLLNLWRNGGGDFDNVSYDATSYNRGWITIEYVD